MLDGIGRVDVEDDNDNDAVLVDIFVVLVVVSFDTSTPDLVTVVLLVDITLRFAVGVGSELVLKSWTDVFVNFLLLPVLVLWVGCVTLPDAAEESVGA